MLHKASDDAQNSPAISLIITVYKAGPFFADCLESVARQTFRDFELILVDDYPEQDLGRFISDYSARMPGIRCVKNGVNEGALVSRIAGIEAARGGYVAFLDYDDRAKDRFLAVLHDAALKSGADVVGSVINNGKRRLPVFIEGTDGLLDGFLNKKIDNWNVWTRLFRREVLETLYDYKPFFREQRITAPEDFAINILCALRGYSYCQVPDKLVSYSIDIPDSATNSVSVDALTGKMASYAHIIRLLQGVEARHREAVDALFQNSLEFTYETSLMHADPDVLREVVDRTLTIENGSQVIASVLLCGVERNRRLSEKQAAMRRKMTLLRKLTGLHYLSAAKKRLWQFLGHMRAR